MVTGVDFSGEAIQCAKGLRDELGLAARFIQANVYEVPEVLLLPFKKRDPPNDHRT